ncbi:MAG: hypothetical protein C5B55_06015 [Blastocatellia bacterium]|nr:MAG: hypothetical protein C5B55_06015 [Blastocatellia bacterium]
MYRFKNSLTALVGLLIVLMAIEMLLPRNSIGQKTQTPQDVRLVATTATQPVSASSPLPVSGTVGITGTPIVGLDALNNTAVTPSLIC